MPIYNIKIDEQAIFEKTMDAAKKKGLPVATKKAYSLFKRSHDKLLQDFEKNPVTQELEAGKSAVPVSDATDGYGNLYSFLGFEANPIPNLRSLLQQGFQFRYSSYRNGGFYFKITTPSKSVINFVTPMPWGVTSSWITAVEKGLDNLDYYMYKKGTGRSKTGFQAPYEINEDLKFNKQEYLTKMLKNFRDRIANSRVNDLG